MNKINLILAFFILPAFTAFSQSPDCFKFKEGKFKITDVNAGGITVLDRRGGYRWKITKA